MNVVDRFLQYVKFDTQSDELTNMWPSTPGQMIFAQHLEQELQKMGLTEITLDDNGYLMATLPANTTRLYTSPLSLLLSTISTSSEAAFLEGARHIARH